MAKTAKKAIEDHYKNVLGYNYKFTIDGVKYMLNPKKLLEQKIDLETYKKIVKYHRKKRKVYAKIEHEDCNLKPYAVKIRNIEFELQKLWGYSRDAKMHRFWETPKCECPKMDNRDAYPHLQFINEKCPLHGN